MGLMSFVHSVTKVSGMLKGQGRGGNSMNVWRQWGYYCHQLTQLTQSIRFQECSEVERVLFTILGGHVLPMAETQNNM